LRRRPKDGADNHPFLLAVFRGAGYSPGDAAATNEAAAASRSRRREIEPPVAGPPANESEDADCCDVWFGGAWKRYPPLNEHAAMIDCRGPR